MSRSVLGGLENVAEGSFEGGDAFARVLNEMPKAIRGTILDQTTRRAARVLQREMEERRKARGFDIGASESSGSKAFKIAKDRDRSQKGEQSSMAVGPVPEGFYWLFQEFGTVKHAAQPLMRPAVDATANEALDELGKQLGNKIESEAQKLAGQFDALGKTRRRRIGRS